MSLLSFRRGPVLISCIRNVQFFQARNKRLNCIGSALVREKSYLTSRETPLFFSDIHHSELASNEKYSLAGEKHLAFSNIKGFPKYLGAPRRDLPHGLRVLHADKSSVSEWAQHCRTLIEEDLTQYGAILFRGLPLNNGNDFSLFIKSIGYSPMAYEGGAVDRPAYDKKAFTFVSTSVSKDLNIEPHSDMAYSPAYPNKIFFYCDIPPAPGCRGLTPISSNIEILQKLDPKVVQKFEEKQVRYIRNAPNGVGYLPWQETFGTDDRKDVERFLESVGYSYEWKKNDDLFYWLNLPPTMYHRDTGEKVWFNQIESHHVSYFESSPMMNKANFDSPMQSPLHTTYGDGTEIETEVLEHIRKTSWGCTVGFPWEKGDVLILDNVKVRHSRLSFSGDRRILVFMTAD